MTVAFQLGRWKAGIENITIHSIAKRDKEQ